MKKRSERRKHYALAEVRPRQKFSPRRRPSYSIQIQLIKFWPSHAPGKGVCGEAKIFGCALLQPARSVCVSLSAIFISFVAIFGCTQFTQQLHPSAVRAAQLLTNYMSCRLVRWLAQESSTLLMPRLSSAADALAPASRLRRKPVICFVFRIFI